MGLWSGCRSGGRPRHTQMRLRAKLMVALFGLFMAFSLVSHAVQRELVLAEFVRIEENEASSDLMRCREAFSNEIGHLVVKVRDWASWDDTYTFMVDRNQGYVDSNLKDDAFEVSDFHLLALLDRDGKVVWHGAREPDYQTPMRLEAFPTDRYPPDHDLLARRGPDGEPVPHAVVMITEKGPMLVSVGPILTSANTGPSRGWLLMGRLLSDDALARLRVQTRVNFKLHRADADSPPAVAGARSQLDSPTSIVHDTNDDDMRRVYGYAPESGGRLIIEALVPREISRQGVATVRLSMISWAAAAGLVCVLVLILLQFAVIGPIGRLAHQATEIGRTGDLTRKVDFVRRDEIGDLARQFDGMVGNLKELHARLMETSRNAGMADVASSVLHNVGNVLNSLNVSTVTLSESVKKSKVAGLARAVDLMERNREDLGAFMTQDQRGKNLLPYLRELSKTLSAEQEAVARELGDLKQSVDHVTDVVRSQEGFARLGGHAEAASIRDVVEKALSVMAPAFDRHGVVVRTELADVPSALLDATKCVQVLVNLLGNAKDALADNPSGEKRVHVSLRIGDDGDAVIEVEDNGVGIEPDQLDRIFANGFTTKGAGHGVGLHYSVLAAREMGGDLRADSEGLGKGARFTFRIPLGDLVPGSAS
jgi:signal transduction histidine kinase